MSTLAEQIEEARLWIAENFPQSATLRTPELVRRFVQDNYPAGGWFGFLADNYL